MSARDDYPQASHFAGMAGGKRWTEVVEMFGEIDRLRVEVVRLRSWSGLMSILDVNYPADVFTGVSGDPGPLIVVKLREIDRLRNEGGVS